MTCGFCGGEFDEVAARTSCESCPMAREGCRRLKCPRCGYENPETPKMLRKLAEIFGIGRKKDREAVDDRSTPKAEERR